MARTKSPLLKLSKKTLVEVIEEKPQRLRTGRRYNRESPGPEINVPAISTQLKEHKGQSGRPPIYDKYRFPHIAYVLCKERGFTHAELARVFDVSVSTINQWVWLHDEFKQAVRRGKDEFDSENVETALLKRALGYTYTEVHVTKTKVKGKTPEGLEITLPAEQTTRVTKEMAADPKSIFYWLQNRQPDRWKHILKIDVNQTNMPNALEEQEVDIEQMSTEELLALRAITTKALEVQQKTIDVTPIERRQATVEEILAAADSLAIQQQSTQVP